MQEKIHIEEPNVNEYFCRSYTYSEWTKSISMDAFKALVLAKPIVEADYCQNCLRIAAARLYILTS